MDDTSWGSPKFFRRMWPIWPSLLLPQPNILPSLSATIVCSPPHASDATGFSFVSSLNLTSRGFIWPPSFSSPMPSCSCSL